MKYWEMGVNPGANNIGLVYFVAPALLSFLYILSIAVRYLTKRFEVPKIFGMAVGVAVMIATEGVVFMVITHDQNIKTEECKSHNTIHFLKYYATSMLMEFERSE